MARVINEGPDDSASERIRLRARVECAQTTGPYTGVVSRTVPPNRTDEVRRVMARWSSSVRIPRDCRHDGPPSRPTVDGWVSVEISRAGDDAWGAMWGTFTLATR